MSSARITSRAATEALSWLLDEDISTVQREEEARAVRGEIDALIEEAEREWATADRAETVRVSRDFTDQRRARRAHRRGDNAVLRSLVDQHWLIGGMVGQGKNFPARLAALAASLDEGEAA